MSAEIAPARYSLHEEIASSAIHGLGIVLSIVGLCVLTAHASATGDAVHVASCAVFGAALVLLYTTSTLYHSVPAPAAKRVLRTLDHAAIYLLIAGTYTPFTLISLRGAWGWGLFAIVWTLALVGIGLEVAGIRRRGVAAALYVGLGWIGLFAIGPLVASLPAGGLWLLFLGGAAYTLGVPFYLWRSRRFTHSLWHAFVLLGSVLQFFAILFYVLPPVGAC